MTFRWEGSKLIIEIDDADGDGTPSKSGKMNLTGTTHGYTIVPGSEKRPNLKASVNVGYTRA